MTFQYMCERLEKMRKLIDKKISEHREKFVEDLSLSYNTFINSVDYFLNDFPNIKERNSAYAMKTTSDFIEATNNFIGALEFSKNYLDISEMIRVLEGKKKRLKDLKQ